MELRFSISFLFDFKVYFSNESICYLLNVFAYCIYNTIFTMSLIPTRLLPIPPFSLISAAS